MPALAKGRDQFYVFLAASASMFELEAAVAFSALGWPVFLQELAKLFPAHRHVC